MRDSSVTRASPSTTAALATVRSSPLPVPSSTVFSTTTWVPANAATCARCVTQRTWWRDPSVCEEPPDRDPRFTADPGVDLVEHQGRRRLREHQAESPASHGTSSPPDAARARGRAVSPGLAARRKIDAVVRRRRWARPAPPARPPPRGAWPARGGGPRSPGEGRRGVAARRASSPAAADRRGLVVGAARLDGGGPLLVGLQLLEPRRRLGAVRDHVGQGLAVLAAELVQLVTTGADRVDAARDPRRRGRPRGAAPARRRRARPGGRAGG